MIKIDLQHIQDIEEVKVQRDVVPPPAVNPTERRSSPRFDSSYNAACVLQTVSYNVEIIDLSNEGARIRVRQGLLPAKHARVSLGFMDGNASEAMVVWTNGIECGLRFCQPLPGLEEKMHFDEMGADFFRSVLKFQIEK